MTPSTQRRAWFLPHDAEWAWLLLCLSGLTFPQRTAAQSLSGAINTTDAIRLGLLSLALVILVFQVKQLPKFAFNPIALFLAYVAVALGSSVWSESPVNTLGKAIELSGAVVIVWIAMARPDRDHRLQRLVFWVIVEVVLALLYVTLGNLLDLDGFREIAPRNSMFTYSWGSPKVSSNSVSQIGALLALFSMALVSEMRSSRFVLVLCGLWASTFPVLAQGRTGMVSLLVGTAFLLIRRLPVLSIFTLPPIVGIAVVMFGDTLVRLFLRGQDNTLLLSLSGRTTWWELGWGAFLRQPVLGAGWGVGSRAAVRQFGGIGMAEVSTLHNGLLEVLLGVGLFGFVLWFCSLIWAYRLAIAAYLRSDSLPFVVGFVVCGTATLLSTGIGGGLDFITQYFLAATALLWVRHSSRHSLAPL